MAMFVWTDAVSVGNRFIDDDHKRLFAMMNSLNDAMEQGRGNDVVGKVLNNLVIYTRDHFRREQVEMQRIGYSRRAAHEEEHEKLIRQVTQWQQDLASGKAMLSLTIARYLRDWLVNHIRQSDKLLAAELVTA